MNANAHADESHPEGCCVEVEIDAASLDTGVADRDAHLRGPDFFDAETHPKITFRSRRLEGNFGGEGDRFRAIGDLNMRDQTMEIVLDCEFLGRGKDPWGNERAGFSAHTDLDRREWGLRWNQAIETGGVLVANRVRIDVEVQFVKEDAVAAISRSRARLSGRCGLARRARRNARSAPSTRRSRPPAPDGP